MARPKRPVRADLDFTARVKADELRFTSKPEVDVSFFGEPAHESHAGSTRRNLPEEVEPGVTYRDVVVDYRLASRVIPDPAEDEEEQD
jgi:hypothetical protein